MNPIPLLWLVPAVCSAAPGTDTTLARPAALLAPVAQDDAGPSYEDRLSEAGDDVGKLWELHTWCRENHKYSESRKTLKRIIELDSEHAEARGALGHTFYDGQWFESSYKLSEYKRAEDERKLAEGLVRLGEDWVPKEEAAFRRMGWVRSKEEGNRWVSPAYAKRRAEIAKLESEGYKQQTDLTWVAPDEQAKWNEGLWKCGDEWLSTEKANEVHSQLTRAWHWPSPGGRFVLFSTLDNVGNSWAAYWADLVYSDCVRAYGLQPKRPPTVTVLRGIDQYNAVANGDPNAGRPGSESAGISSCHHAHVGELWFDVTTANLQDPTTVEYLGGGICYWDRGNEKLEPFGKLAVRHAAALSYAEAIDPSYDALSKFFANPNGQGQMPDFWTEKRIPRWFRYGVASYCEAFYKDSEPPEGFGEWWVRDWALNEIRNGGGPRPMDEVFAFNLDPNDQDGSRKLLYEAGMLVSFVLDGDCRAVKEKHAAFKAALREGGDTQDAIQALQEAIKENAEQLHLHVGM